MQSNDLERCPRCGSAQHVRSKELLIGAKSPKKRFNGEQKSGYVRVDQLAVDECKPELLRESPLQQLVAGFNCEHCDVGFVSDSLVRVAEER